MSEFLNCSDCSARFGVEADADEHEAHTGHTVHRVDVSRHVEDVRLSERLNAQAPRGRRERHMDAHGPPRSDY